MKSLAVDRNGILYTANPNGIFVFDGKTGERLRELKINRVESLAVTRDQKLAALVKNDLKFFEKDLKQNFEVKDIGKLANASMGIEKLTVAADGSVFSIDRKNGDICKFSAEGKFLNRFSSGTRSPNAVAVNSLGQIFISDGSAIIVFDGNGKEIGSFKTNQAFGITFDQSGDVFVASRPFVVKYNVDLQKIGSR